MPSTAGSIERNKIVSMEIVVHPGNKVKPGIFLQDQNPADIQPRQAFFYCRLLPPIFFPF
jgi:hypothetical protein